MAPKWLPLGLACGLLVAPAILSAKDYRAERFDVRLSIQPDGSVLVTETVVFSFQGGPFTFVYRDLATKRTDGIDDIHAAMDGQTLAEGIAPGSVEVHHGNGVRITWRFNPVSDSSHRFDLSYRVFGLIRQLPEGDALIWEAIPRKRSYAVAKSAIEVQHPADLAPVSEPRLRGAQGTLDTAANAFRFATGRIRRDRAVVVTAVFPPGSLAQKPPQWQAREIERNRRLREAAPAAVGTALAVFLAGLLLLAGLRDRHQPDFALPGNATLSEPPARLEPALAGRLVKGGRQSVNILALATLFDLARRGAVRIEQTGRGRFTGGDFWVVRQAAAEALTPPETALMRILFGDDPAAAGRVRLSQFAAKVGWKYKQFDEPLRNALLAAGYIDPEREQRRRRAFGIGVALLLGSAAALVTGLLLGGRALDGADPGGLRTAAMLIGVGAGLFLFALAALIAAGSISPLSPQGAVAAQAWRSFERYLKEVARGRQNLAGPRHFEDYLPYATAFGLGPAWAKQFRRREDVPVPAWFQPAGASGAGSHAAFIALLVASSSSAVAGAGGVGASGGGGSGAG